jgi:multiple sugar transport system permease protein
MFPPIVITLPLFPVANRLGLNDTSLVLVLLYATFFVSLSTWIVKAGVDALPYELEEAAMIDGASVWQRLRTVVLPLVAPSLVAAAVFVLVFAWNEFLFAFVFTTTKAKTALLILSEMMGLRRASIRAWCSRRRRCGSLRGSPSSAAQRYLLPGSPPA